GADVVGDLEAFTGGHFGEVAVQLVARGEAHGVHDAVQAVPPLAQFLEDLGDVLVVGDVAGEAQVGAGAPAGGEIFHAALELVVLVGESELGTFAVHGRGDACGDRQLAGDTDDQYALTGEKTHVLFLLLVIWRCRGQKGRFQQLPGIGVPRVGEDLPRVALL